jgi:beta-phosphoglucomutase
VPIVAISRNMVNKRAVLWDMDGVLVDTGELHYQSWLDPLAGLSIVFDRDTFKKTFGMNNAGILTILLEKPPAKEILERVSNLKESRFRELLRGHLQLLPGALQWLHRLWEKGTLQAIASSAPDENIAAIVDEAGIRQYFSALISAYSMPSKPDPAVFLEAAGQLGVEPRQCTVVEDAIAGVTAAKKAGMKCIAVCTTNPRSSLSAADIVVDDLEELTLDAFY